MNDWQFILLVLFAFGGWLLWFMGIYISHKRKSGEGENSASSGLSPIGSRIVDRLYRLARWMVAIARASDVALVEYRVVTSKPSDSFADQIELLDRSRSCV